MTIHWVQFLYFVTNFGHFCEFQDPEILDKWLLGLFSIILFKETFKFFQKRFFRRHLLRLMFSVFGNRSIVVEALGLFLDAKFMFENLASHLCWALSKLFSRARRCGYEIKRNFLWKQACNRTFVTLSKIFGIISWPHGCNFGFVACYGKMVSGRVLTSKFVNAESPNPPDLGGWFFSLLM